MSILDTGKVCVASEINVVVTRNGQPITNATVQRYIEWEGVGEQRDSAVTDDTGAFILPAVYMRSLKHGLLPEELVATAQITVETEGEVHEIMTIVKRYHKENAEFGGKKQFFCELNNAPRMARFGASILETRCTWK